ncbi:glucose-6-phosphatase catalytic subunit 1 [Eupeodes corollae]|uniref:glucose-6-phosphatase catalytic subunit 1 n=1 Tax=Eupeodes corollae TaxID=290404 RepID=UPI00248FB4C1|nr:glucose-6-phosphatase catalytic subunit 1 [Eupeodes corollae]
MADYYVQYALHSEALLTTNVQEILQPLDSWLVAFSEYFSPESLIDNVIPIIGTIDVELMGEMAVTLGLLNVISSVIKWVFPVHRPTWWIRENNHRSINIKQSPFSCDTSPGFPSAHSMSFTGFVFIFLLYLNLSPRNRWLAVTLLSIPTWIACVYFGSHFLHQCICGSIVAVLVIESIRRRRQKQMQQQPPSREGAGAGVICMKSWRKITAIAAVTTLGLFVIGMYFAMLYAGLDPHWSVRMAFKWCPDPYYLRHETSPIFIMCRDLGFMMGVALSSPFTNRLHQRLEPKKSIPAVVVIVAVGFFIRSNTPKNYGRVVFVGYEFIRNAMHSYSLLTILPNLCKKNKSS